MLRRDVIDAIRDGRCHVWGIEVIDEGIELLTGIPAGDVDLEGTFDHILDQRLQETLGPFRNSPALPSPLVFVWPPGVAPKSSPPPLPGEHG